MSAHRDKIKEKVLVIYLTRLNKHWQVKLNLLYGSYNLYCALGAIFAQTMNTKHGMGGKI